jgi:hypothetical protein
MPAAINILFGALFTVAVCTAAGRILLRWAGVSLHRVEENALAFVTGAAPLSLIVFLLAALHVARKGVFLAVGLAIIAAAVYFERRHSSRPAFPPLPRFWKWLFVAIFSLFTVLYFFNTMAPEFSPDGVSYHLQFVSQYLRAHGLVRIPMNMYAHLSQGIEMLFLFAFAFGRHSSAALVHYAFLLALTFAILSYGRRVGHPVAGIAAALFVYLSPVVGIDGTTAYIDVAAAAIVFTTFYLLQIWDRERGIALLAIVGLVSGFAFAAKYTAFLAVPYAVGYVLWRERRLKPAAVVAVCSVVLIAPWVIKNILWVANPLSPLLNAWFPNPYVHISMEQSWSQYLRSYDLASRWSIPMELTMGGGKISGLIGPLFLLIPLAFLALRTSIGRRVLFPAVLFALPYFGNIGARFFIPPLPFFAFALAYALSDQRLLLGGMVLFHALTCWPGFMQLYCGQYAWKLNAVVPWKAALRIQSEDVWLSRKQPDYRLARLFEQNIPPGKILYTTNGMPEAYTTREIWVGFQSACGEVLNEIFYAATQADFQPVFVQSFNFPPQLLKKVRVIQTAPPLTDEQWSITEFRIDNGGQELPRQPEWRLTAHPNPWEVQLAFDNSPVTRWRTWQRREPGMYVEVDFGKPQTVDRVRLDCGAECARDKLRLEGMDASGRWITLANSAKTSQQPTPGFMGKGAMREFKARGVDYIFLRDSDFGAPEVLENPEAWGLTPAGRVEGGGLYRIDAGSPILVPAGQSSPEKESRAPLLSRG